MYYTYQDIHRDIENYIIKYSGRSLYMTQLEIETCLRKKYLNRKIFIGKQIKVCSHIDFNIIEVIDEMFDIKFFFENSMEYLHFKSYTGRRSKVSKERYIIN